MSFYEKGLVRIHYEEAGSGLPLLLIAGGAPTVELDVHDRVGGGDGFASGFFYGLLTDESPEEAVNLGCAHGALLTTIPGDTTLASMDQVRAFARGGSARIQR